ncbi:MAG: S-layer homology domain-containing protein [Clostridia bacterium]|nr:S-layer homology domain-containing protein [Clostridia bacterium]
MKKFFKVFLLVLAVASLMTLAVLATEADHTIYADGTIDHTVNVRSIYTGTDSVIWLSSDGSVATVNSDGLVTAVAPGYCDIIVMKSDYSGKLAETTVEVKNRQLVEMEVSKQPTKKVYNSGDSFEPAGMEVTNIFDNGDRVVATSSQYELSPKGALKASDVAVIVTSKIDEDITAFVQITVKELTVSSLTLSLAKTEFAVGDLLTDMTIKVIYSDGSTANLTSGYEVKLNGAVVNPASRALTAADKTVAVSYRGVTSDAVNITVSANPASGYTATINGALARKVYVVGNLLNWEGITSIDLKSSGTTVYSIPFSYLSTNLLYRFKPTDVGQNTIKIEFKYNNNTYPIILTGLTVSESLGDLDPYQILDIELEEDGYPVGYTFDITDIDTIRYTEIRNGNRYRITGDELALYEDDMSLEVLTKEGDRKPNSRKSYRSTLEKDDVFTVEGKEYANIRLYINDVSIDTAVEVTKTSAAIYYGGKMIAAYAGITDALRDTMVLSLDEYLPTVGITIVLGEDDRVNSRLLFKVDRNVQIDLSGHKLEFYSDTVDPDMVNAYGLEITNSAKEQGKFVYYDEDLEIKLDQDDYFYFTRDYDDQPTLPGVYMVEVDISDRGEFTSTPKADKDGFIIVPHGNELTLTVTPDKGYKVDEFAVDRKSVIGKTGYTKNNGVVTYKTVIKNDCVIMIDFEKGEDTETTDQEWVNPFTDVNKTDAFYDSVRFVYQNDLFKGVSATRFSPSGTMTRAMFVTVLGRLAGISETEALARYGKVSQFTDVTYSSATSWYVPYIAWANQMGLIVGYGDGKFGPDNEITHQQMYVIMKRYATFVENKSTDVTGVTLTYTDRLKIADWAEEAVKYAKSKQFIVFTATNTIDPTGFAKRSELAVLLQTYCKTVLGWTNK